MAIKLFAGTKGGPGKTTTACNTAVMRAIDYTPDPETAGVLLIDGDKAQSSKAFGVRRVEHKCQPLVNYESMLGANIHKQIQDRQKRYTDIVIDCGGHDSEELRAALLVADELIIPIRPNQLDIDTLPAVHKLLDVVQSFNPELRSRVLMCQLRPGTVDAKRALLEKVLKAYPLCGPLMRSYTTIRSTYEICQLTGKAVVEFARKNETALAEMNRLHKEIWQ